MKLIVFISTFAVATLATVSVKAQLAPKFKRGDANQDGVVNGADPVFIQNYLFSGGPTPPCKDAADADDSGVINLTDSVYLLNWLFQGGPAPPNPGPTTCGFDPTHEAHHMVRGVRTDVLGLV